MHTVAKGVAINESGQVVRLSHDNYSYQAFATGTDGADMTHLNFIKPTSLSMDINDSGQITGSFLTNEGYHIYITGPNGTGLTDLGTLGGWTSYPTAINNSGQIVGLSTDSHGVAHAFIAGSDGAGMVILDTLAGSGFIRANDINDSGEVVGQASTTTDGTFHSFLFSHGGVTDLSMLDVMVAAGYTGINVTDINNNGQMIGMGVNSNHENISFLLSYTPETIFNPDPILIPVPEPETYAMLLAGLGLIGFMARSRREKRKAN